MVDVKGVLIGILFVVCIYFSSTVYVNVTGREKTQSTSHYVDAKNQVFASEENQEFPIRLTIPTIQVDAAVEYVGLTPEGAMAVPSTLADVGWFDLGPRPGDDGSAVIAGHYNGEHGEKGVFAKLHLLKKGDKVYVESEQGKSTSFVVRDIRMYDPGYAYDVFKLSDKSHLNLITCSGVWDKNRNSYSKRLVVFTDKE